MKYFIRGYLPLLLACLFWGASPTFTKLALSEIPPLQFVGLRFLIAGIILIAAFPKLIKKINKEIILAGLILACFLSMAFIFETLGLKYISSMKSALLVSLETIFIPLFYAAILRMKSLKRKGDILNATLRKGDYISTTIAFIGIIIINFNGIDYRFGIGEVLTILAAAFYACFCIVMGEKTKEFDFKLLVVLQLLFIGIIATTVSFVTEKQVLKMGGNSLFALLLSAVFSCTLSYLLQAFGQKHVKTSHMGVIVATVPVFGVIVAKIVFNNIISKYEFIGIITILVSIVFSNIDIDKVLKKEANSTVERRA